MGQPTLAKLRALRLDAFAAAWTEQQKTHDLAQLSFDERLGLLVDAECLARENKRLARLFKEASSALVKPVSKTSTIHLVASSTKPRSRQLATCRWVQEQQSIVITGPTGVGKTFVACAFAQQACRKGFSARRSSAQSSTVCASRLAANVAGDAPISHHVIACAINERMQRKLDYTQQPARSAIIFAQAAARNDR